MTTGGLLSLADDFLNLLTNRLKRDAKALERLGGHAFTFVDQAEQNVFSANVVVVKHAGFLLGKDYHSTGSVCKPLEHWPFSLMRAFGCGHPNRLSPLSPMNHRSETRDAPQPVRPTRNLTEICSTTQCLRE